MGISILKVLVASSATGIRWEQSVMLVTEGAETTVSPHDTEAPWPDEAQSEDVGLTWVRRWIFAW